MNAFSEQTHQSPVGRLLASKKVKWMMDHRKYRSTTDYLDRMTANIPAIENDPDYIPYMELQSYCLLQCGLTLQADAAFDQVRQRVRPEDYSRFAKTIDTILAEHFVSVDPFMHPKNAPEPAF